MGINRVQFQKGLSMAEFMERYGTEEKCHAALVASRWPNGFVCSGMWQQAPLHVLSAKDCGTGSARHAESRPR